MKNTKLIIVLGMHRSGTSSITRGLQVLDVELGNRLMPAMEGVNDKGFWEDIDITGLNVEMLKAIGSDWHSLVPISSKHVSQLCEQGFFARAVELLRNKVGNSPIYGFKDPRIAKLLPFWRDVFTHCQFDVGYVLAIRHPLSVAQSLVNRDGFDREHSYLLWLGHVITSLTYSEGCKRVFVDYDRLMQSPEHELARVAKQFGLKINQASLQNYTNDFLEQTLRHSKYEPDDLTLDSSCPAVVREAYIDLLEVASDRKQDADIDFANKNCWGKEFERLQIPLQLIDKLLEKSFTSCRTVSEQEAQIATLNEANDELNTSIDALNISIDKLSSSIREIHASTSWRLTKPARSIATNTYKLHRLISVVPHIVKKAGGILPTLKSGARILKNEGVPGVKARIRSFSTYQNLIDRASQVEDPGLSIIPYYIDPNKDVLALKSTLTASVAVHLHLSDIELPENCFTYLSNIPGQFDLYVSVPELADTKVIWSNLTSLIPNVKKIIVKSVPNHIGHVAAMVTQFGGQLSQYEIIGHLRAAGDLADWEESWKKLIGPLKSTGGRVEHIFELLRTDVTMIFSEVPPTHHEHGTINSLAKEILQHHSAFRIDEYPQAISCADRMFWANKQSLHKFLSLTIDHADFIRKQKITPHALDLALGQLVFVLANAANKRCFQLIESDSINDYRQYENQHDYSTDIVHSDIKILSYYLPQFHPTPENDLWHGKGFTEWTKVRAATPLFQGHYQQHIPHPDIGYYLLDSPDILRHQADMMKKAGVHGQIFYHYWFSGKLILEDPAKLLLANPDIHMPFCFCWANENWTRRWDGNDKEILLGQHYSKQDAQDFIQYLIPFFKDPRYIKVEDRPMLQVYRPLSIPNVHEYLDIWASECEKHGIPRPYVVAVLTRGATNPDDFGMDAGVERVLHDWTDGAVPNIKESLTQYFPIHGSVLPYDQVAKFYMGQTQEKAFTYFRSTVPIWDNTARYGSDAYVIHGSTAQHFQEWMESSIAFSQSTLPKDRRFIAVNAWNEWAEGAHLEPDTRYGYSYLNSIGRALSGIPYKHEVNRERAVISGKKLHFVFSNTILTLLKTDPIFKRRFMHSLEQSSVLTDCSISANSIDLANELPNVTYTDSVDADFTLEFKSPAYFDASCIANMAQLASATGAVVIPHSYGGDNIVTDITSNGAVHFSFCDTAPMLLIPRDLFDTNYKNVRMSLESRCFITNPSGKKTPTDSVVTTIIRFHKSGDFRELRNALFCLYAMNDCFIVPLITAQDLSLEQSDTLKNVLAEFSWAEGHEPIIRAYQSENGQGDLRSKMLNEALKSVKTNYATFLDFDDLLMPHAYRWLIEQLKKTKKAVSFGRVYLSTCHSISGQIIKRTRTFERGYTYDDFYSSNHAPLHSFMLDLRELELSNLEYYDDQTYMEDYFLTLQLFSKENADWDSLKENHYIGDYIHCLDRSHTLAIINDHARRNFLANPKYLICEKRICDIRKRIKLNSRELITAS